MRLESRTSQATTEDSRSTPRTEPFHVAVHAHRRTALVELTGELELATAATFARALDQLEHNAEATIRHLVMDLRGLTFMDLTGMRELIRQGDRARARASNMAVVRGSTPIALLLDLKAFEGQLVVVDHPDDLAPPGRMA
jgi:anti-sigma B factor antagonist